MIELEKVGGIGEYEVENYVQNDKNSTLSTGVANVQKTKNVRNSVVIYKVPNGKAFLVDRGKTIEVRTERNLANLLREKYESVMESRYFGKGGVEVVMSGQLADDEVADLVRLSYNLTKVLA